jgi:segregation and condensation protein B
MTPILQPLWEERPPRYSRALFETLALIAYRQPITRGEIEDVRGVAVSPNIIRTLLEREWIRVLGHRDVPGKPEMFGTTKAFLDYFGLKTLDDLPPLAELQDFEGLNAQLDLAAGEQGPAAASATVTALPVEDDARAEAAAAGEEDDEWADEEDDSDEGVARESDEGIDDTQAYGGDETAVAETAESEEREDEEPARAGVPPSS